MDETRREQLSESVMAFIRQRFPATGDDLTAQTPLLNGGGVDSLGILEIAQFLTENHGVEVTDEDFVAENFETVDALVALVLRRTA